VERITVSQGKGGSLERIRFGEFLLERRVIDDGQLLDALAEHWAHGGRLGAAITRRGILSVDQVERLAAEYHGIQVVEVATPGTME
jgi:hypothetical protein